MNGRAGEKTKGQGGGHTQRQRGRPLIHPQCTETAKNKSRMKMTLIPSKHKNDAWWDKKKKVPPDKQTTNGVKPREQLLLEDKKDDDDERETTTVGKIAKVAIHLSLTRMETST